MEQAFATVVTGSVGSRFAEGRSHDLGTLRLPRGLSMAGRKDGQNCRRSSWVADELHRFPPQVALAWLRHRDVPAIPIIGARKLPRLFLSSDAVVARRFQGGACLSEYNTIVLFLLYSILIHVDHLDDFQRKRLLLIWQLPQQQFCE